MPIRVRRRGRSVPRAPTDMPSTRMLPCWNDSSPFMHFTSVLLPDPDGPQITTTSPRARVAEQSRSTGVLP